MSIFTLAISCLTTSNLSWFMDLTVQVPMQYCTLQHWTLIPSPVTSTIGCCFLFGSVSSFSEVISLLISRRILGSYRPGEFIFQCTIFLSFHALHVSHTSFCFFFFCMVQPLMPWQLTDAFQIYFLIWILPLLWVAALVYHTHSIAVLKAKENIYQLHLCKVTSEIST